MFQKTYFFLLLLLSTQSFSSDKSLYTKTDLEILQNQKSFKEFFAHAKDIPPREREKSWYEMLSDMGTQFIDQQRSQKKYQLSQFQRIEKLSSWPELKRDEFFQVKREAYTVEYLKHCLTQSRPTQCRQQMLTFWQSSRRESETGLQLMLLNLGFFPQTSSYPFIEKALISKDAHFYCGRPMVQKVFLKHLNDLNPQIKNEQQGKTLVDQLAEQKCWKQLRPFLITELFESKNTMLFSLLDHLGALNPIDRGLWLTLYYLDGPAPGKVLNLAWNNLETIAQNYSLRGRIYQRLTEMDPLPGKVFAKGTLKRRRALTNHLSKNFPEYIRFYSKNCVDYLSGAKLYDNGNPTMECHELFALDEKKQGTQKMISQEVHLKYSATTRPLKN